MDHSRHEGEGERGGKGAVVVVDSIDDYSECDRSANGLITRIMWMIYYR